MRIGVVVRSSDDLEMAEALEAVGVHDLWFGIDDPGGDPMVLAGAAAVTTRRVGLTVMLDEPTPVAAKAVASLDALSAGRVRVVVSSKAGLSLLRSMLSPESTVPIRPAPVQQHVPVWTTALDLPDVADGVVVRQGSEPADATHVALVVNDLESCDLVGVEEVVLSVGEGLWETVGKVLRD
jgi:alkanesulfonate monooxygenase SsuD/methylene tetrahydromethanopterin reductase-like flavin-dependent oxidoreductase (luciferase family)